MPGPIVSVPESPPLPAVVISLEVLPPKTIEPVPPRVWAPTKWSPASDEPSAAPSSMVPSRVRPPMMVTPGPDPVMSSVPSRVTPESVPLETVPTRVAPPVRSIVPPLMVPPESVSEALRAAVVAIERLPADSAIGS